MRLCKENGSEGDGGGEAEDADTPTTERRSSVWFQDERGDSLYSTTTKAEVAAGGEAASIDGGSASLTRRRTKKRAQTGNREMPRCFPAQASTKERAKKFQFCRNPSDL